MKQDCKQSLYVVFFPQPLNDFSVCCLHLHFFLDVTFWRMLTWLTPCALKFTWGENPSTWIKGSVLLQLNEPFEVWSDRRSCCGTLCLENLDQTGMIFLWWWLLYCTLYLHLFYITVVNIVRHSCPKYVIHNNRYRLDSQADIDERGSAFFQTRLCLTGF